MAPPDLLDLMSQEEHGLAHVARGEVKKKSPKNMVFVLFIWVSKLIVSLVDVLSA